MIKLILSVLTDFRRRYKMHSVSRFSRTCALLELDCKTVRIFAYSSKREQSNKRSGTRLKTESETGERLQSMEETERVPMWFLVGFYFKRKGTNRSITLSNV